MSSYLDHQWYLIYFSPVCGFLDVLLLFWWDVQAAASTSLDKKNEVPLCFIFLLLLQTLHHNNINYITYTTYDIILCLHERQCNT